jgi:hypothetical protein
MSSIHVPFATIALVSAVAAFLSGCSPAEMGDQGKSKENAAVVEGDQADFRAVRWGMSRAEVKGRESAQLVSDAPDGIMYEVSVAGHDAALAYFFVEDSLTSSIYQFTEEHTNKNDFIEDYNELKQMLTRKYGVPAEDTTVWKDRLYQDDPSQWGMAVATGGLALRSKWQTARTEVALGLVGDNFKVKLGLIYLSKDLYAKEKAYDSTRELEGL